MRPGSRPSATRRPRTPPTMELTAAAREARAAVDAKKEDEPAEPDEKAGKTVDTEEPKPALPMQKSAPNWAQTSPVAEAESEGDGEAPATARPMQKPTPEWAKTVPETSEPVSASEPPDPPVDADAKPAVAMAKEAPRWAETIPKPPEAEAPT